MEFNSANNSYFSKMKKFKIKFYSFMEISTIQGLPKVFLSTRVTFKFLWLFLTIISSISCAYFSTISVLNYLSYDTITLIKTINEHSSEFPTVSICHYNNSKFKFHLTEFWFNKQSLLKEWQNNIESYNDIKYGICYRINSGKNINNTEIDFKRSILPGSDHSLRLDMYIPLESTTYGVFKIHIHNKSQTPLSLYEKGIFITTGNWHYFTLKRTYDIKLEQPYSMCIKDVRDFNLNKTLINFILQKKGLIYSQKECLRLCLNLKYIEQMKNDTKCRLNSFDDDLFLFCYGKVKDDLIRKSTLDFIKMFQKENPYEVCSIYCPLECESMSLEITHDIEPVIPHVISESEFPNFRTFENVSLTFLSIRIYYEDLIYTLIEQQPKWYVYDLVSNIGGTLGLFLGMGFLSLIEFFEIFIEFILIIFFNK